MASKLHEVDDAIQLPIPTTPEELASKSPIQRRKLDSLSTIEGTTAPVRVLPREHFAYWCFDLLFTICGEGVAEGEFAVAVVLAKTVLTTASGASTDRKRLAALALPSLLSRCRGVFTAYIVDEALRGSVPFPRFVPSLFVVFHAT